MEKHRGFPSRLPGTDMQFTIRRANKDGATKLIRRERYQDRRAPDRRADEAFMWALWTHFGDTPFVRGNLDAGRISWMLGREIVPVDPDDFDDQSYDQLLRIDEAKARTSFPGAFDGSWDA